MSTSTISGLPIHHKAVPYTNPASRLRTLDIWLPRPLEESHPKKHVWIIYIHGGAWRDPTQTSQCVVPALQHVSVESLANVAGIASINYRLSRYPSHPTSPSSPTDSERNVQHPSHVQDLVAALNFLGHQYGLGRSEEPVPGHVWGGYKWLGAGHSCGATLLLQYVAYLGVNSSDIEVTGPTALLLFEGIYDLEMLWANHRPPKCPADIAQIYEDFLNGAFSKDHELWNTASPIEGKYTFKVWREGRLVFVGYSKEDELVEEEQGHAIERTLMDCGWKKADKESEDKKGKEKRLIQQYTLRGGHDWIWEDGEQIAEVISEALSQLVSSNEIQEATGHLA